MSSTPTLHKSPWTSKVNSFLYVNLDMTLWTGILLDHRHFVLLVMTSTTPREDGQGARGMESDKTVAWNRRRKRSQTAPAVLPPGIAVLPPQRYRPDWLSGGPDGISSGTAAVLPPGAAVLPLRDARRVMKAPAVLPPGVAVLPLRSQASSGWRPLSSPTYPPFGSTL